jgi:enterobactin synthetase component D
VSARVPVEIVLDRETAHGRCVGVALTPGEPPSDASCARLVAEERAFAATLTGVRRATWVGGRIALREALARIDAEPETAILASDRGAPVLTEGLAGSVSHKETIAVALVAREATARIGVDVELDVARRIDVARHVLTDDEARDVNALPESERVRALLIRFSAKESIYKAVDPFVRRYVSFKDAEVWPREDGSANVLLRLRPEEGAFSVDVRWWQWNALLMTSARIDRA